MTFYRVAFGLLLLSLNACNCGTKLEQVPNLCDYDPTQCPVVDAGSVDAGAPDAGTVDAGMACPGGTIVGRICAPDQHTWVNGATVTVDATDCNGKPVQVTATSGADGHFEVDGVPAGHWTVHAASGSFSQDLPIDVAVGQTTSIPDNQLCVAQGTVKIAVVTGSGDKIETLLDGLSLNYTLIAGDSAHWSTTAAPFLTDLTQMKQYDIIFFDCAAAHVSSSGTIDLGSQGNQIHQNLQAYVAQGGSVYASDWALVFAYYADPGAIDFLTNGGAAIVTPLPTNNLMGYAPQTVSATIADAQLSTFLGKSSVSIDFPKMSGVSSLHWGLIENVSSSVQVLVQASTVQTCSTSNTSCSNAGVNATSIPLAVQVKVTPVGQRGGKVVYTSFHNVEQTGDDVAQILKYLILNL